VACFAVLCCLKRELTAAVILDGMRLKT